MTAVKAKANSMYSITMQQLCLTPERQWYTMKIAGCKDMHTFLISHQKNKHCTGNLEPYNQVLIDGFQAIT